MANMSKRDRLKELLELVRIRDEEQKPRMSLPKQPQPTDISIDPNVGMSKERDIFDVLEGVRPPEQPQRMTRENAIERFIQAKKRSEQAADPRSVLELSEDVARSSRAETKELPVGEIQEQLAQQVEQPDIDIERFLTEGILPQKQEQVEIPLRPADQIEPVQDIVDDPVVEEKKRDEALSKAIADGDLELADKLSKESFIRKDLSADALLADKLRSFREIRQGRQPSMTMTRTGQFRPEQTADSMLREQRSLLKSALKERTGKSDERSKIESRAIRDKIALNKFFMEKRKSDVDIKKAKVSLALKLNKLKTTEERDAFRKKHNIEMKKLLGKKINMLSNAIQKTTDFVEEDVSLPMIDEFKSAMAEYTELESMIDAEK